MLSVHGKLLISKLKMITPLKFEMQYEIETYTSVAPEQMKLSGDVIFKFWCCQKLVPGL